MALDLMSKKDILESLMRRTFVQDMTAFRMLRELWERIHLEQIQNGEPDEMGGFDGADWDTTWLDDEQFYCERVASYTDFATKTNKEHLYTILPEGSTINEVLDDTEDNAYGLEDQYRDDFNDWSYNYKWFGRTFQEWIQDKQEYLRGWEEEQKENDYDRSHDRHYKSCMMDRHGRR